MKNTIYILFLALLTACVSDNNALDGSREQTVTVADEPNRWTYISLESGRTVGTCALGDSVAERSFSIRTDWDIAICNGVIRTNGGTSGVGRAGITSTPKAYEGVDALGPVFYESDSDTVRMARSTSGSQP